MGNSLGKSEVLIIRSSDSNFRTSSESTIQSTFQSTTLVFNQGTQDFSESVSLKSSK